ncbi:hypothetical protein PR048_003929 [Dryococelus australis]|uniref:Uncharacterized protein n=1 Tax=Dryococelus australis TaxID=614101 RepID=A0ABQ9IQE7_9NEOP|nr:hypothetical protein PR048_003929 [Dryococelus australis]
MSALTEYIVIVIPREPRTDCVYNLNTAAYQESTAAGNNVIVPIVKADSSVSSIKGLINSKACFPQFGGIGESLVLLPFHPKQHSPLDMDSEPHCTHSVLTGAHISRQPYA